jgi:hypothetical protein
MKIGEVETFIIMCAIAGLIGELIFVSFFVAVLSFFLMIALVKICKSEIRLLEGCILATIAILLWASGVIMAIS